MSNSNPSVERVTLWTYTEEEIYHRWEIHQRFDILNRYAKAYSSGSGDSPDKTKIDNSEDRMSLLESILPEQGG